MSEYLYHDQLLALTGQVQPDSILSRTLLKNEHVNVVLFTFDKGQALSPHKATQPAIIQILSGEATLTLGDDVKQAKAGSWVYMPTQLVHGVVAETPLVMLLLMLPKDKKEASE
jgi:quercetin dioxygenase-like cupin family protein